MQKTIVPASFIRADGTPDSADCIELNTGITTLEDGGWYVVNGPLNYGVGGLVVSGSANLVLADGAALVVTGATKKAGVNVASGNTLTIYAQSAGTGALIASGNANDGYSAGGAGMGGNDHENCGTITINGGVINAYGGNYSSAGIGGGANGAGGTVTINGGAITSIGGTWYGAGIGGGYWGAGGNVTINGGTITATAAHSWRGSMRQGRLQRKSDNGTRAWRRWRHYCRIATLFFH